MVCTTDIAELLLTISPLHIVIPSSLTNVTLHIVIPSHCYPLTLSPPHTITIPPSQTYTADPQLEWTDVREWVVDTYPWQPSMNVNKLRTLNPEDVGWNHGKCEGVEGGRGLGWKRVWGA